MKENLFIAQDEKNIECERPKRALSTAKWNLNSKVDRTLTCL